MREHRVTLPQLAMIGSTRGMLGFGIGLLVADRLAPAQRRATGLALVAVGALTTIPLAVMLFRRRSRETERTRRDDAPPRMVH